MSVTFNTTVSGSLLSVTLNYWCDLESTVHGPDLAAAQGIADVHHAICALCSSYQGVLVAPKYEQDGINMANGNAADVLILLGYPVDEMYGSDDADSFLGRVLVALGLEPYDEGRPTLTDGNFIQSGTHPGYRQHRLNQLHDLALWAKSHQSDVNWG